MVDRGNCWPCPTNCLSCYQFSSDTCITCNPGYQIATDGKNCKVADPLATTSSTKSTPTIVYVKDTGFKSFHYIIIAAGVVYLVALIIGIVIKCRTDSFCDSQLIPYQDYANLPSVPMAGGPLPIISASAEPMLPMPTTPILSLSEFINCAPA